MHRVRTKSGNVIPATKLFEQKETRRFYVVANRAEAMFYQGSADHPFELVRRFSNPAGRLTESQLDSDRPGRGFSSAGAGKIRHALDQRYARHEKEAQDFAAQLAKTLDSIDRKKSITDLTLVAEPHFLGLLRRALSSALIQIVKYEIKKEYVQMSDREIFKGIQNSILEMGEGFGEADSTA